MTLQAQQIVTNALQIAKAPGFKTQAGQFLNSLLSSIARNYDFPQAQQLITLNVGPNGGTAITPAQPFQWYPLPLVGGTWLRTKEVFYNQQGVIFWLNQLDKAEYDQLFQGQGISNYPYWYVVDTTVSPPQMAFYPPPNVNLVMFIRVQFQPADISNPETSTTAPWFPDDRFLTTQLAADVMQITGDSRKNEYRADAADQFKSCLLMIDDKENVAQVVKLDPLRFRAQQNLSPTKQTGF